MIAMSAFVGLRPSTLELRHRRALQGYASAPAGEEQRQHPRGLASVKDPLADPHAIQHQHLWSRARHQDAPRDPGSSEHSRF